MTAPSDADLNRLVAEKVAGWTQLIEVDDRMFGLPRGYVGGTPVHLVPLFATSADAVLPLLLDFYVKSEYWCGLAGERPLWRISINCAEKAGTGEDHFFARACCLALLKAAGVEDGR